jgi:hypothetical protein
MAYKKVKDLAPPFASGPKNCSLARRKPNAADNGRCIESNIGGQADCASWHVSAFAILSLPGPTYTLFDRIGGVYTLRITLLRTSIIWRKHETGSLASPPSSEQAWM